jgi:hypothetical protein
MKRLFFLPFILCGLFPALAAVPAPEALLASDTLALITVPDYTKAKTIWGQWPSTRLWNDAALKPFRDKFTAKLTSEYIVPLERELGIKFEDYTDLAQGQVTFALTQSEWDGKSDKTPAFLFLVDSRDKSELLKTKLAEVRKKWVDSGKKIRTDKIRDIEFTTLLIKSDEFAKTFEKAGPKEKEKEKPDASAEPAKPTPPRNIELLIGQSGSLLILGNSAKDVEKVLIRQTGGAVPGLGEQAAFAAHSRMFRDASSYVWINAKPIIDTFTKSAKPDNAAALGLSSEKLLSAIGITALQTIALTTSDSPDGLLMQLQINVPESGRKGIFKMLAFDAKDAAPLPFIPADAIKFSRWRLDLQKTWNTFESTLGDINPQFAGGIKMMVDLAGKDKDPNFDLRKSLLLNLGDDIISYSKPPRSQTLADLGSPPSLILISSPKAELVASSIRALSVVMPQSAKVKEREFLGRKVYAMSLPSTGGGPQSNRDRVLSYAASGGYVVFSTDVATLEEYLRGNTANSLRDTPGLAEAAQKIGGQGTGLFGYENQAETMRATLETLKKESGSLASMFKSPFGGQPGPDDGESKLKDWVDFNLLPSFDRISKYFHFSVWGGAVTSDGFNFKFFAPTPPQLKK